MMLITLVAILSVPVFVVVSFICAVISEDKKHHPRYHRV